MRKYDDEFKREAVKKIHDGQSVASVARELGCAESLLRSCKLSPHAAFVRRRPIRGTLLR